MKTTLDECTLKRFQREMDEREYSPATKRKYTHILEMLLEYAGGKVGIVECCVPDKENGASLTIVES